jgi:hypothetical protein
MKNVYYKHTALMIATLTLALVNWYHIFLAFTKEEKRPIELFYFLGGGAMTWLFISLLKRYREVKRLYKVERKIIKKKI